MYGIVNQAIEDLIVGNYGEEKWLAIKEKSGIDVDFFLSNEVYDDNVTYQLAGAAADVLQISVNEVLIAFGEHWVLKTGMEKYGSILTMGGQSFKEFLVNLPSFHNRLMLLYPKLSPPEFMVSSLETNSLHLHYISKREGLQEFVRGLIQGIAKMFQTNAQIELIASRSDGNNHEIFKITW
ncbi:MAG: heme NO-binding domain-containing protein [Chitinophagaceae bacterium]